MPERYLVEAEKVAGSPYSWGLFDVAILPPSFAYGGMENPNVTFFSSSLLAGDSSLLTTLAHEIAHSWSGNLVTNSRWKDFWLNEGFTRYIERRILGRVGGKAFRGLVLTVGYNDLVKTVDMLCDTGQKALTRLETSIVGIDPDQAFNRVPYEKGGLFMYYLEQVVGGEDLMTEWLIAYIKEYSQKSIETNDFKAHFITFFEGKGVDLSSIDWEHWIHGEGMPNFDLSKHVDHSLLDYCRGLADKWLSGGKALMARAVPEGVASTDFEGKKAQEVMLFLDHLINAGAGAMSAERLVAMDEMYTLSETKNVEVGFRWVLLNLKNEHKSAFPFIERFLSTTGRGSYVKPSYIALDAVDHDFAVKVFRKNEGFYQAVIAQGVRKILKVGLRHEMRVTTKRSISFYAAAARNLIDDSPDIEELCITGLGEAVAVAVGVGTSEGLGDIVHIETGQFQGDRSSCAQISVVIKASRAGTPRTTGARTRAGTFGTPGPKAFRV